MKNKITLLNMVSALVLQVLTMLSGFIIPKIVLVYFGSDVNGLISSLNQFLSYISLVEGGITSVVMANLYKPLIDGDTDKLNSVISTSRYFFRKIGLVFALYTVVLSLVYPLVFNVTFSYTYVCSLTVILSVGVMIQYMFSLTLKTLLCADKKVYVVSITQSVIVCLGILVAIISVKVFPSIHMIKLLCGLLYFIQPISFNHFYKKYYDINWDEKIDNSLIKQRWNGFAINTAAFIHECTDIALLTIFTDLKTVSVYSVYYLVINGLKSLISSVTQGLNPTLGLAYARNNVEEIHEKLDLYEYIINLLVFYSFTTAALLITPFVMIYTFEINDANYYQPIFGTLLIFAEALYLLKFPHLNLAYSANRFKEITKPAYIEATINIIVSICFVKKYGLIGVTFGTITAMIFRMAFHVYFTSKMVSGRRQGIFYKKIIIFGGVSLFGYFLCITLVSAPEYTIGSWLLHALVYSLILGVLYFIITLLFFKKEYKYFVDYLKRRKK